METVGAGELRSPRNRRTSRPSSSDWGRVALLVRFAGDDGNRTCEQAADGKEAEKGAPFGRGQQDAGAEDDGGDSEPWRHRALQDDVAQALLLNETDPEAFAATAGLPLAAGDLIADDGAAVMARVSARRRQIGLVPPLLTFAPGERRAPLPPASAATVGSRRAPVTMAQPPRKRRSQSYHHDNLTAVLKAIALSNERSAAPAPTRPRTASPARAGSPR
jgi:hypothetical protein